MAGRVLEVLAALLALAVIALAPAAPALMGTVVVWKPAPTQQFAAHSLWGYFRTQVCRRVS
jgi:hypothetical protein